MSVRPIRRAALLAATVLAAAVTAAPAEANAASLSGPFHLINRNSGKCLTIQNASTENDALAIQFTCNSTAPFNEAWFVDNLRPDDSFVHLVNQHSNRCLTIQNASTANDAKALQFTCETAPPFNEEWQLVDVRPTDSFVHVVNRHSGKCLTVQNASLANDARAIQFPCDTSAPFNEEWQLVFA